MSYVNSREAMANWKLPPRHEKHMKHDLHQAPEQTRLRNPSFRKHGPKTKHERRLRLL